MTKTEIYKIIHRQYETRRAQEQAQLLKRQEAVYKTIPRIKEIDTEVSLTGVKIAKLVLNEPQNSRLFIERLKTEMNTLKEEKNVLLKKEGFLEDFLRLQYHCEKCKDTGYVGDKKCACFQQMLVDLAYSQSNIKDIIKIENFDTFDFRYYGTTAQEKEGLSPRENIQNVFSGCMNFTNDFDTVFTNLLFYGGTGLGKTFLCNCIAKELMDKGKTVLYMTAGQLFKIIEDSRFHKEEETAPEDYMEDILTVDLFIIDDLGTEFSTMLSSAELFHIINTRILHKKPTILSTNLAPADLINQYSDRIVSRLTGSYKIFKLFGEDIRMKKKFQI